MAQYRRDLFRLIEAAFVGIIFVQAVRFLYMTLYAHVSSASFVSLTQDPSTLLGLPGVVNPSDVQIEVIIVGVLIFLPLLSMILSRLWFGPALAAIVVIAGRSYMTGSIGLFGVIGGAVAASGALLYIATIAVRRPNFVPVCFVLGFGGDQLIRLYGKTLDMTLDPNFLANQTTQTTIIQTVIFVLLFFVAVLAAFFDRSLRTPDANEPPGEISGWSAFALAGLLYLEFVVFGLPNILAHRAGSGANSGVDYATVAPWLVVVTLLPLVAEVRDMARRFLGMFDGPYRGWVWFLMTALLVVLGFRLPGLAGAIPLLAAQLLISLSWWWVVQPADERRNFTAPGVIFAVLLFLVLTGADFFTYEYAFVRDILPPFDWLPSLLRGMRGLGLAIVLFATLLTALPAILARKRLPWRGGRTTESLAALTLVIIAGIVAGMLASPVVVPYPPTTAPDQPARLRVATLNLHAGYSLYFGSNLPQIAVDLAKSGADVILLQEVEAGRLTSGSVDQAAWLGRALNMRVDYFPTNEGIQGIAILSRLPLLNSQGILLTSIGKQTGVLYDQFQAPNGVALDVYNTQLGLFLVNSTEQDQDRQIQEILAFVAANEPNGHLIIGGTFNSLPGTDNLIYAYMSQRGFGDPLASARVEKSYTLKRVNSPNARVDYLWTKNITVDSADTPVIDYSNHNMVVIELTLGQ